MPFEFHPVVHEVPTQPLSAPDERSWHAWLRTTGRLIQGASNRGASMAILSNDCTVARYVVAADETGT